MALPLWLATLNPGGKTKSRRRRKLSKWQQEVKRAGGFMQAVKARRSRKHSKRRSRRNPFLTVAKVSGAFAANASRRRKRRKHATRRSAGSRRVSLRSRSRRAKSRRPKMARARSRRHRRTPPRGASGRFKSRRSRRSRKHRRNPVVPVSWNPRRKRRRSRRRNPLYLTRKGRFSGRGGRRRLHMRRRHPRHWHNNPVVPVSWNPRRRRSSRRRGYRRNPVLPFFAMNPVADVSGIIGRVKSMIDVSFWTETGLPATVGFFGSKALGQMVYNYIPVTLLTTVPQVQPFFLAASQALSGAGMAWATGKFLGKKQGDAVWLGTVVNVSYTLISTLLKAYAPSVAASIGMSGMGDAVSDRLKEAVTKRVQASLSGYLTVNKLRTNTAHHGQRALHGSYMTVESLNPKTSFRPGRMDMAGEIADDSTEL
jgi:hypothetical protein